MPDYRIAFDHGDERVERVEHHASMEDVRRAAVRFVVGVLLDDGEVDGPLSVKISVRDLASGIAHLVRVSVLISHTIDRS